MEALDNIKVSTKVGTTSSDSKIEIQNNKKTKRRWNGSTERGDASMKLLAHNGAKCSNKTPSMKSKKRNGQDRVGL